MITNALFCVILSAILFFVLIHFGFWDIRVRKIFLIIFSIILLGAAMNKFTRAFNNGKMPVYGPAAEQYYTDFVESNRHKLADEGTKFIFLIDRIPSLGSVVLLNFWGIKSGGGIFSIGDVFVALGFIALGALGLIALRKIKFICFTFLTVGILIFLV
mgnify:CR=1 FL=1